MSRSFIITFAGVPGTSKTPIAFYLSHTFRLPMIQMDAIRLEVREDLGIDKSSDPRVVEELHRRASPRYLALLQDDVCFIDDCSVDRSWKQEKTKYKYRLEGHEYHYFIISMDLSLDFIRKLHVANRSASHNVEHYFEQHQQFLDRYSSDVDVRVTDETFTDRMDICEQATKLFLASHDYKRQ